MLFLFVVLENCFLYCLEIRFQLRLILLVIMAWVRSLRAKELIYELQLRGIINAGANTVDTNRKLLRGVIAQEALTGSAVTLKNTCPRDQDLAEIEETLQNLREIIVNPEEALDLPGSIRIKNRLRHISLRLSRVVPLAVARTTSTAVIDPLPELQNECYLLAADLEDRCEVLRIPCSPFRNPPSLLTVLRSLYHLCNPDQI
jgi:hypothetical protein